MFRYKNTWKLLQHLLPYLLVLVGLCLLSLLTWRGVVWAEGGSAYIEVIRLFDSQDSGLRNPAGLAFSPQANVFYVVEATSGGETRIVTVSPYEDLVGSTSVGISLSDPVNVAFDSRAERLLLGSASGELIAIQAGPNGQLDTSPQAMSHYSLRELGIEAPRGMAVNPTNGELFVLDSERLEIVGIRPDAQGGYDGAAALGEGRVTRIALKQSGLEDPHSLAYHPGSGHLYLLDGTGERLHELSPVGRVLTTYDLLNSGLVAPLGLALAPSGDPTDDPSIVNMYITAANLRVDPEELDSSGESGVGETLGTIVELSFTPRVSIKIAAPVPVVLIRTTDTSLFDPPSPDPAGLAFLPGSNTLLISDSEVEEMPPYFEGYNLFQTTLSGTLTATLTTTSFSNEPTGVAFNPVNAHLFFSDDDARRVYELNPGPDGLYNTPDDIVTWFNTSAFGNQDPEGITYDTLRGHLFVVDELGEEVYQIDPGPNGIFDGVPPTGDDVVMNFDTTRLGARHPEGVEHNPDGDFLYILSSSRKVIVEATIDGRLIRTLDISSLNSEKAAGLTNAPASSNPAQMHLYIVARGIDNNTDPNENDGKLYEVYVPPNIPTPSTAYLPIILK